MEVIARFTGHVAAVASCAAAGHLLASGGEDGALCVRDVASQNLLTTLDVAGAVATLDCDKTVSCLSFSPNSESVVFAAVGHSACQIDLRSPGRSSIVHVYNYSKEDVGGIAVHSKGTFLALGDDSGAVQVIDLAVNKMYKTMRQAHSNICSSVAFRQHRPWEMMSGALDMTVARWEFSRGKLLCRWRMGSESGNEGLENGQSQMFNPPMVHQLALADTASENRMWSRTAAAAVGDGSIFIFDTDTDPDTTVKRGDKGVSGCTMEAPSIAKMLPGLRVSLDSSIGGHNAPASCLCFVVASKEGQPSVDETKLGTGDHEYCGVTGVQTPQGQQSSDCRSNRFRSRWSSGDLLLVSGGEDKRILIWSLSNSATLCWKRRQKCESQMDQGLKDENEGLIPLYDDTSPLVHETRHKRKINSMCVILRGDNEGGAFLSVADTGRLITCYRLPC